MYGIYYKTAINFQDIIEKKDLEKTSLEGSIAQYISLVVTSSFGECKFNELFGCEMWETDFDQLSDNNSLRDSIKKDIEKTIKVHESRLKLTNVEVVIGVSQIPSYNNALRLKKKVTMIIQGFIKKTNRPFNFETYFFVGPLSYT
jgi:phage baseplate assembly protein W